MSSWSDGNQINTDGSVVGRIGLKLASYTIWTNGTDYEAVDSYGKIAYGGSADAGGVDGADFDAVFTAAEGALATSGGTIVIKQGSYSNGALSINSPAEYGIHIVCEGGVRFTPTDTITFQGFDGSWTGGCFVPSSGITVFSVIGDATANANRLTFRKMFIGWASKVASNIGFQIENTSGHSCYYNKFEDITFTNYDYGLKLVGVSGSGCNANYFDNITCGAGNYGVSLNQYSTENNFGKLFFNGTISNYCIDCDGDNNIFNLVNAEATSSAIYFNTNSSHNWAVAENTGAGEAVEDAGSNNCYIDLNQNWIRLLGKTSDPSTAGWGATQRGRLWTNLTSGLLKYWDGSAIHALSRGYVTVPFVDGTACEDEGWDIDQAAEYARAYITIPAGGTVRYLDIYAYTVATETDAMHLEIHTNGAALNEAYNTHTYTGTDVNSTTTNFTAGDIIYWRVTDAGVTALTGGDSVEVKVIYEDAGGDDCATDARFRNVVVWYY